MKINLVDCLPSPPDGSPKRLLPKQQELFADSLNPSNLKYLAYVGGVGSGKTIIGCLIVLAWALAFPGDYLIARQFMPELRITTYKTFLDMCPKELIVEHRVADAIVRVRSGEGKTSNIIFRGLDEPDKLRSLNLNAAYIDEASQVSEPAFTLLQTRLRGPHIRRILLTTNPAGHDWIYGLFFKQDGFSKEAAKLFKLIRAPSTENTFLPEGYVESMMSTFSQERIQREIMASFDAFEGMVYPEFRRDLHVIPPFQLDKQWPRYMGMDHGYRNPAAAVWGAVDGDNNVYIYREFYEKEWLIEEICRGKGSKPGIVPLSKGEKLELAVIDPSTRAARNERNGEKVSDFTIYLEHMPVDFPLRVANNDVTVGIDRVKSYLKPQGDGKPKLYIFDTCPNLIEELTKYRYQELRSNQVGSRNEKEAPRKHDDHLADAIRYLMMTRPEPYVAEPNPYKKIPYNSLEGSLYRELKDIKNPKASDPWQDN